MSKKQYFKTRILPLGLMASLLILFTGCGASDGGSGSTVSSSSTTGTVCTNSSCIGTFTCNNGVVDITPNGLTRCTTNVLSQSQSINAFPPSSGLPPSGGSLISAGNNGASPAASSFPGVFAPTTIGASGTGTVSSRQPLGVPGLIVASGDWISFRALSGSYFQQLNSGFFDSCSNDGNTTHDLTGGNLASVGYQPVLASTSIDTNPNGLSTILAQPASGCIPNAFTAQTTCTDDAATVETQCLAAAQTSADVTNCQNSYNSAVAACNSTELSQAKACLTSVPDGFIASIGGQIYVLGNSFNSSVNVAGGTGTQMGQLIAGLNKTPWSNFCADIEVLYFKHQHCVDSSGNPAVCPDPTASNDPSLYYP